ncbi:hypothetical protein [Cellulosimicrobium sp. Marseille-Q4280]|uniref:hypothetical protein n=1 Tax=Cellulosimicrobium sp. Marseille-Q4280 TaxID=2937992 RepID=UPI00203BCB2A|nr:hypothetical protein [Cellulosimicrobium sp. Marseille-Q4280]
MNTTEPERNAGADVLDVQPERPARSRERGRQRPSRPSPRRRLVSLLVLGGLVCGIAGAGALALVQTALEEPAPPPTVMGPQSVVAPTEKPADPDPVVPEPAATQADGTAMPKAGDTFDADPGLLTDGLRAIGLNDGTWHVVDPFTDLPEPVVADIVEAAAPANGMGDMQQATAAREDVDTWVHSQTGLHPVLIIPWTNTDGSAAWAFWARDDVASFLSKPGTKDEVLAAAQEWIDAHENPFPFTIIVTE